MIYRDTLYYIVLCVGGLKGQSMLCFPLSRKGTIWKINHGYVISYCYCSTAHSRCIFVYQRYSRYILYGRSTNFCNFCYCTVTTKLFMKLYCKILVILYVQGEFGAIHSSI